MRVSVPAVFRNVLGRGLAYSLLSSAKSFHAAPIGRETDRRKGRQRQIERSRSRPWAWKVQDRLVQVSRTTSLRWMTYAVSREILV